MIPPYQKMMAILQRQHNLLLFGHISPDADCLGSMLALYHALDGGARNWRLISHDRPPAYLDFLPGIELFIPLSELDMEPRGLLLVDCGDLDRCGYGGQPGLADLPFYVIDHHTGQAAATFAVVETEASAVAEIMAAMIPANLLDQKSALCLYAGIASDTNCFRYPNTTRRTLRLAADLLAYSFDRELAHIKLFESRSRAGMALFAAVLNHLDSHCRGRLATSYITLADKQLNQAAAGDSDNLASIPLQLEGGKMALLFEEEEDEVRVSLRCRLGLRVDQLAVLFGGGGHELAAGCTVKGDLAPVMAAVMAAAAALLADPPEPGGTP